MTNVDARIICFMTPGSNSHSQNAYKNLLFLLFSRTTLYTHIHTLYSTINIICSLSGSTCCHEKRRIFDGREGAIIVPVILLGSLGRHCAIMVHLSG